ncbi:MAG: hypothetical protein IJN82_04835 [Clostridia bacterium]|nr:hypothetical protein [Clostridia bacterium]
MHTAYFDTQTTLQSNATYRFDPEKSNIYLPDTQETPDPKYHDICASDRERPVLRTAFYLKGLENVTLDFGGATLLLHGRIQPFLLDQCRNVTIKNVTVEYERSLFTELEILSHTEGELRTRPKHRFPCRVENGYFIPYSKDWEDREVHVGECHFMEAFDSQSGAGCGLTVAYIGEEIVMRKHPPAHNIQHVKVRGEGEDIIFTGTFPAHWDASMTLAIEHEPRDKSNLAMYHCQNVRIENYRILNGCGMGLYAMYTENITVDRFLLYRDEQSHGIVTNSADGIHFVACKGRIEVTDSIFEGTLDDAVNIHANYYQTVRGESNTLFAARSSLSNGLSAFSGAFQAGDEIAVYHGNTLELKQRFLLQGVQIPERWQVELTTDRPADGLCEGDLIENLSTNPQFIFRRCRFGKANTHLRLQSRGSSLIEDCLFELPILLSGDTDYWFEASPIEDLTIRNCRFCGERGRIDICPRFNPTPKAPYYHSGVTVTNCTFDNPAPLKASHAERILFTDCTLKGATHDSQSL